MSRRSKNHKKYWGAVLLAGILALLCTAGAAAAPAPAENESRVLRVAFTPMPGISEIDEYGNRKGLLVDYLNEIAKYTNWEYEYVDVAPEEMVTDFLNGKYDLMGGTFYLPQYEKYFVYPKYSTGRSVAALLCRKEDDSLRSYDLSSLNGKTIGVYEQAEEKIRYLKEFLSSNNLDCQIRYYSYEDRSESGDLYPKLRAGEVDMLMGNEMEIGREFRMVTSFQAQPYYIVTKIGNDEILEELNMALGYILESKPDFAEKTYNANFPDIRMADIQFNEKEQNYIAEQKTLSVAVIKSWHPLYCMDNQMDHHNGIIPDVLSYISEFTGLDFTYVYAESYREAIEMVRQGKADILGAYMDTDEQAFSDGLALTQPYIVLNNIVFKNKAVSYPGSGLTCGIQTGRILPSDIEAEEVKSYVSCQEMLEAANEGEVDFIYGLSATLEQEMQKHRYLNVVPVTRMNNTAEITFAISRPIEPELLSILEKVISNMSQNEIADMLNDNQISVGYSSLSLKELVYANPFAFIAILLIILVSIMMGILMAVRSRMRSSLMKSELKAAEAKSQAKSEFLSRMSHEIRTPMNAIVGLTDLTCMEKDVSKEIRKKLQKIRSSSQYLLSLINDILDMSRIENGKMEIEQENFSLTGMLEELEEMVRDQVEQKVLLFHSTYQIDHEWLVGDSIRLRQVLTNLMSNAMKFTPAGGVVSLEVTEISSNKDTAAFRFSVRDTGVGISEDNQKQIFESFEQVGTSVSRSAGTGLGLPISQSIVKLMGGELQVASKPGEGAEFYMTLQFPIGSAVAERPEVHEQSLEGVRVLLAEDNSLNAEIAQELLATQGMLVQWAVNGQEAVELFNASEPGTYQIVLMDICMPVKDGIEAAKEIRASGRTDDKVPIIAMTANSFKEDELAALAAGMNGFVPKPVDPQYLFSVLHVNLESKGEE